MLMTSMMKEAGFDAEQIETYQEMSKKNFSQMIALEQNDKLKQSERDVMMKKIISNEEAQLKKLFGDERFEKYLEMQKQLNDN